jgi:hypothetical protein
MPIFKIENPFIKASETINQAGGKIKGLELWQ